MIYNLTATKNDAKNFNYPWMEDGIRRKIQYFQIAAINADITLLQELHETDLADIDAIFIATHHIHVMWKHGVQGQRHGNVTLVRNDVATPIRDGIEPIGVGNVYHSLLSSYLLENKSLSHNLIFR
jgi:exonuclease III